MDFRLRRSRHHPVLFVEYLSYLVPGIVPYKHLICVGMVWICAAINLAGIVPTGRSTIMLGIAVIVPFAAVFALVFARSQPHLAPGSHALTLPAFGMGLFTVLWNYLGWDNASPLAEEVEQPLRSYRFSFVLAFLTIVGLYTLSVLAAESTGIDPALLERDGFPLLASQVGGAWLGSFVSLGGMASALGIFLSTLLYISRLPKAIADDRLLPASLGRLHPRTLVPHVSILLCSVVVSAMVFWDLADLLIIDVTLYGTALVLEFISLIALRVHRPDATRPFRIPLGTRGLVVLSALPTVCFVATLGALLTSPGTHEYAALFALAAVASGPLAWAVVSRGRNGVG